MTGHSLVAVFAIFAGIASGQTAGVSGLILDPSNSPISGAEVNIRNEHTGGRRSTSSNTAGLYSLPSLTPGEYRLSIRAAGFQTIVREGIKLEVGENARIDFSLQLGDVRTEVTVHGDRPLINSEDASVGTVIDRDTIDKMPLNGRGIQALIELSPGVVAVPVTTLNRGQFAVNGQRGDANYVTVDGVSANFSLMKPLMPSSPGNPLPYQAGGGTIPANNFLGTFSNLVSPDALQEFRIQTSTFAPEFGRFPGAQIGLVTRSGTNRYSGSLFEYFRNDKTDANDWFANRQALPKAPLRFNNFGGSLGGPVRIPHMYDGHDRTFFFLSIEDVVMLQPQGTVSRPVPTLEARQNAPPLVAALLNAYPLPNRFSSRFGDPAVTGFSEYAGTGSLRQDQQTYGLRLDHAFNDKLMPFVRYNRAPSNRLYGVAPFLQKYSLGTETLTIGLTQALTPKLVNEIRLNGSRQFGTLQSVTNNTGGAHRPPDSLFFPPGYSSNDSFVTFGILPWYVQLGFAQREASRQLQIVDNVSWSSGAHQFKAGADYRWFSPVTTLYRFSPTVTFSSLYGPAGAYTGIIPFAQQSFNNIPSTAFVVQAFSAYVQDTWKARRGLTLTYGLRWEVNPAPRVSAGQAAFVGGMTNPADYYTIYFVPSGKPIYATSWSNFAPRLGIGWQIHGGAARKTVLRIGAGRFFDLGQGGFESGGYNAYTSVDYTDQPLGSPTGGSLARSGTQGPNGVLGNAAVGAAHGYNLPYTWQWNAAMEQSIGQQTFSVGYVGALGRRLIGWTIGPGAVYSIMNNLSSSSYNAMQLQFNRRLSSRLRMLVSYTWSHSIDNLSQDIPHLNLMYSVSSDPRAWGSSDFDVRHSLNGSIIAALPSSHRGIAGLLFRNWTANSIFFARSALPTDLVLQYSLYRPDVVPGQPLYLYGPGFPGGKSINGAAFSIPPNGRNGDLGRNVLRGLGAWQIDFALHRDFRVSEGLSLQLRAEAFNILNHPNFANPGNGYSRLTLAPSPGFGSANQTLANGLGPSDVLGQLSSVFQIGGPRSMQFALRLRF